LFSLDASSASAGDKAQWNANTILIGAPPLAVSPIDLQEARLFKFKELDQFEVAEQETIGKVLTSLQSPGEDLK
jgi:hypothetical protein